MGHCIFYPLPPGGRHPDIRPLHKSFYWISKHFEENKTGYPSTSLKLRLKTGYPSTLLKFRLDIRALLSKIKTGYPRTMQNLRLDIRPPLKVLHRISKHQGKSRKPCMTHLGYPWVLLFGARISEHSLDLKLDIRVSQCKYLRISEYIGKSNTEYRALSF